MFVGGGLGGVTPRLRRSPRHEVVGVDPLGPSVARGTRRDGMTPGETLMTLYSTPFGTRRLFVLRFTVLTTLDLCLESKTRFRRTNHKRTVKSKPTLKE